MARAKADLGDRTTYLGTSEIGAACGYSTYQTTYDIWARKTGRAPAQRHKAIFDRGHEMETVIIAKAKKELGIKVTDRQAAFVAPGRPFLITHVDGVIPEWVPIPGRTYPDPSLFAGPGTFEAKAPGTRMVGEYRDAGLPTDYVFQAAGQQACSEFGWTRYAFLDYDGWALVSFDVARDQKFNADMLAVLDKFWACVVADTPPPTVPQLLAVPRVDGTERVMTTLEDEAGLLTELYIEFKKSEKMYEEAKKLMGERLGEIGKAVWPEICKVVYGYRKGREMVKGDELLDWSGKLAEHVRRGEVDQALKMAKAWRPSNFTFESKGSRPLVVYPQGDLKIAYKKALEEGSDE